MKNIFFFVTAFLFFACTNTNTKASDANQANKPSETGIHTENKMDTVNHAHVFACPMHPEITGKEGDTCSKCGMTLVQKN